MFFYICVRDGCRPYVEVYQAEERILTTQQDYDRMTLFNITHGKVNYLSNVCRDIEILY